MKYKHIGILSAGHMATDLNQGALPAMLPFFIAAYDLSYAAAAAIVFAVNMSSSVVQPLFGLAADRFSKPWLLPIGLMLAGLGLALTGLVDEYSSIMVLAVVSGIGIAAYHPEAARLVNYAAGDQKSTAMSIFGVGGTLGFTVGPLIIGASLPYLGLKGSLILLVPVTVMSLIMIFYFPVLASLEPSQTPKNTEPASIDPVSTDLLEDNWGAFSKIAAIVSIRSVIFFGLNIFIPLYWINELGQSKTAGAVALSVFSASGIIGNIIGGSLADKIGQKKVTLIGFWGLLFILPLIPLAGNVALALTLLVPAGGLLFLTYSPVIVLGQKYLPRRVGFSSGVTLGLAVAIGGGAAPFIGKLADMYGLGIALVFVASVTPITLLLAYTLPDPSTGVVSKSR